MRTLGLAIVLSWHLAVLLVGLLLTISFFFMMIGIPMAALGFVVSLELVRLLRNPTEALAPHWMIVFLVELTLALAAMLAMLVLAGLEPQNNRYSAIVAAAAVITYGLGLVALNGVVEHQPPPPHMPPPPG